MTRTSQDKIAAFTALERKRVCLTAYTTRLAELLSPHVDMLLVGDSLGMVLYGHDSTQGVTLAQMINHGGAVRKGAGDEALIIVDMPYGTYEDSNEKAVKCAAHMIKKSGCDAVKLEGGTDMAPRIKAITDAGIPVMGHIGLTPQSAPDEGGFKIKGKTDQQLQKLLDDLHAIEDAGVFAFVLEGTIRSAAERIVAGATTPVIGIGASDACDGQILVSEDMLGLTAKPPKFVKRFGAMDSLITQAAKGFAEEVKDGAFPQKEHMYENR